MATKILIVDDSKAITNSLKKFLEIKEFDCIVTNNATCGMKLILEQKFNVVILDFQMPEITGLDMIKKMKYSGIDVSNVIILSASAISDKEKQEISELGIFDYLRKPVPTTELLKAIVTIS